MVCIKHMTLKAKVTLDVYHVENIPWDHVENIPRDCVPCSDESLTGLG